MVTVPEYECADEAVGEAIGAGAAARIGRYEYDCARDRWRWSADVYRIHGYRPGELRPTTELVLAHKHPDDRTRVEQAVTDCLRTGAPFSCYHRIIDAHRHQRHVVIVGEGYVDAPGTVTRLVGYFVDVTAGHGHQVRADVEHHLDAALSGRAVIEQAKGAMMLTYGIDADVAWSLLRRQSQEHNIKLRDLADRLVQEISARRQVPAETSQRVSHLLLSVADSKPG